MTDPRIRQESHKGAVTARGRGATRRSRGTRRATAERTRSRSGEPSSILLSPTASMARGNGGCSQPVACGRSRAESCGPLRHSRNRLSPARRLGTSVRPDLSWHEASRDQVGPDRSLPWKSHGSWAPMAGRSLPGSGVRPRAPGRWGGQSGGTCWTAFPRSRSASAVSTWKPHGCRMDCPGLPVPVPQQSAPTRIPVPPRG